MGELRARLAPVPTVVLTGADTFTDRVEAARLGGRGFVQKPIAPVELLVAVSEVIDRARESRTATPTAPAATITT